MIRPTTYTTTSRGAWRDAYALVFINQIYHYRNSPNRTKRRHHLRFSRIAASRYGTRSGTRHSPVQNGWGEFFDPTGLKLSLFVSLLFILICTWFKICCYLYLADERSIRVFQIGCLDHYRAVRIVVATCHLHQ